MNITVLTPTFNRANLLLRVYESLCQQTTYDFEWLIVDDGSEDNTDGLIKGLQKTSPFKINYIKKVNGGKHSALNLGFKKSTGKWILMLDSDDWLRNDCISNLNKRTEKVSEDDVLICFHKVAINDLATKNKFPRKEHKGFERITKIKGEKADLIKKSALNGFSFPEFQFEKFMLELPLFIWLCMKGNVIYFNYDGYIFEYQKDGLSKNSLNYRYKYTQSTLYTYELAIKNIDIPLEKIKYSIQWWRFKAFRKYDSKFHPSYLYFPFGILLLLRDILKNDLKLTDLK